jgi:hypothetical protein
MGNTVAKCPNEFQSSPVGVFKCVYSCPENRGFILQSVGGNPHCVYKDDTQHKLPLTQVDAMFVNVNDTQPLTLQRVQTMSPEAFNRFKTAKDNFNRDFPVLNEKIDKQVRLRDAFKALQDAENVRDQSPEAYQQARVRYYTLLKGDTWKNEEKNRIAKAEVEPVVRRFQEMRDQSLNQIRQQQVTRDVVTGVKDKVVSLRDELKYSVDTFGRQITDIKNQIHIQNQKRHFEKEKVSSTEWIDWLLNGLIIILLAIGIFMLVTRLRRRREQGVYSVVPATSRPAE